MRSRVDATAANKLGMKLGAKEGKKEEGKTLAASKVYTFQGTDEAGRYIHQNDHDTYIGAQAQIDRPSPA